jgi:DNA polymerase I
MGDSSDNIPGVRGVGEKTAIKLIQQFGTIEKVYENLADVPGKSLKSKLEEGHEQAMLSRELVTIDRKVPLPIELEDLRLSEIKLSENKEFLELIQELELSTLYRRITESSVSLKKERSHNQSDSSGKKSFSQAVQLELLEEPTFQTQKPVFCKTIGNEEEWNLFQNNIQANQKIALAIYSQGKHQLDYQIQGIALSINVFEAYFISFENFSETSINWGKKLKELLENSKIRKLVYDLKKTLHALHNHKIELQGFDGDVMIAAHLSDPLSRRYDLDFLIGRRLNRERSSADNELPPDRKVSCEDASTILELHELFEQQLTKAKMLNVYRFIEIPLAETLAHIELSGVRVDTENLGRISREFEERLDELRSRIHEQAGEAFNLNSVVDLQNVLYEKFKLHERFKVKPKKIKLGNGMSTDEETLEKLCEDPLPREILDYRSLNKLKNTYIDQLPDHVHSRTGNIHSRFQQTSTATGRLSSDNPNLQNIPVRSSEGRRIRGAFVPFSADHILISADYSQIELRIVAHYSKDPTFLEAYRNNDDIHALTASAIFKVPMNGINREMRSKAKEVNFGLIYKMGPERLSIVTKTSRSEAKAFIERFFEKYSTIQALQERFLAQARKEGYTTTLLGRRRYLPDINGKGLLKRMAEGAAVNTPIQGSAAEVIKLAMIRIQQQLKEEKMKAKMILTVHDELIFDVPTEEEKQLCEMVKDTMENVMILEVPLLVEIGRGKNWLEAH